MIFLKRRAITVFFLLAAMFAGIGARVFSVANNTQAAASAGAGLRFDVAQLRGTIYDCNLKPLTNAEDCFKAIAKPTQKAIAALEKELDAAQFDFVREKMLAGEAVCVEVRSTDCNGKDILVVSHPVRYGSLACHIIGYCGYDGTGVSGIEKAYDSLLASVGKTVTARVEADANGRVLLGENIGVSASDAPVGGVVLTVDADIQRIVENALDSSGTECSAAMVIDVKTGAIKACVSRPVYDPKNVAAVLNDPDSPLINRAFLPFSVGSVFKPVVAAAALENGVDPSFSYVCTGSVTHNGVTFNCHKKDGHGKLDMKGATAVSCNTYFIALALETGAENIIETAELFGFGRETYLADGMISHGGNLPETADSDAATANLSFGQGELTATPLQICAMMAALANGGSYVEPYLVEGEVDANGNFVKQHAYSHRRQAVETETAELIQTFLEAVVEEGSGKRAKSGFVTCAGKTATAQTGKTENGEEIYNAWFAGCFPAEEPKYAVVILKENGGEGALSCAPVFKEIAESITALN